MGFLKAIQSVFSAFGAVAKYFSDKQQMDAGRADERGKQAEQGLRDMKDVKHDEKDIDDMSDDELDRELFGNDKNEK